MNGTDSLRDDLDLADQSRAGNRCVLGDFLPVLHDILMKKSIFEAKKFRSRVLTLAWVNEDFPLIIRSPEGHMSGKFFTSISSKTFFEVRKCRHLRGHVADVRYAAQVQDTVRAVYRLR